MMTIKTTTWSDSGVEITRIIETTGRQLIIQNWNYCTHDEYWNIINEKFNTGDFPFETIGECPLNDNLAYNRRFLYIEYFDIHGDRGSFVLNFGKIYIMQDGKTVESDYIKCPNDKSERVELTNKKIQ